MRVKHKLLHFLPFLCLSFCMFCLTENVNAEVWTSVGTNHNLDPNPIINFRRFNVGISSGNFFFNSQESVSTNIVSCIDNSPCFIVGISQYFQINKEDIKGKNVKLKVSFTSNSQTLGKNDLLCSMTNGVGNCSISKRNDTVYDLIFEGSLTNQNVAIHLMLKNQPNYNKVYEFGTDLADKYFDMSDILNVNATFSSIEMFYDSDLTNTDLNNEDKKQHEENKGFFNNIINTIKNLPSLIVDGFVGLFVPSGEELNELLDNFKESITTKLGAIGDVLNLITDFFGNIDWTGTKNSLTFPEVKVMGHTLIEAQPVNVIPQGFEGIQNILKTLVDIILTLAFINMLKHKYEGFVGGNASDY